MEDLIPDWPGAVEEETGIFFTVHDVDFEVADADRVAVWLAEAIEKEGFGLHRIDYIFCSDDYVLEVNRMHLDHDFYTDIITFPLHDNPIMAEIYISIDRVRDNAHALQIPFDTELYRVMIHGVLHLCGYDDHEEEDIRIMRSKEEAYLSKAITSRGSV